VGAVLLYLAVAGLLPRVELFLAALLALVGFGVFFRVGYGGSYRHEGLYLVFLLSLYWIARSAPQPDTAPRRTPLLYSVGLYGALLILILGGIQRRVTVVDTDIRLPLSSSQAFGAFLNSSEAYHDAILVPEPDYYIEPLPYYVHNAIYFPREHRFGATVSWTTDAASDLSLGQLLADARDLKARYGRPVLIVLGHPEVVTQTAGDIQFSYNKRFTWSAQEHADVDQSLLPVAEFLSAVGDENYRVYALK
jgi:hypothetical protein